MKNKKISIALLILILVGLVIFIQFLIRQEKKTNIKEIFSKGNTIVSLISLHSIKDFKGKQHDIFMRTIMENTLYQGLAYCFINDLKERPIVSLDPENMDTQIPNDIKINSLAAMGLIRQQFQTQKAGHNIYEFAKPIFENNKKTGSVRVGLKVPTISLLSMERVRLIAMLLFFIMSSIVIVYYGFVKSIRKLEQFSKNLINPSAGSTALKNNSLEIFGTDPMLKHFQESIVQFMERLEKVEKNNTELASCIGVLKFEKNQVVNILNSIHFGIIITNLQGNIDHINNYLLNLFGKTRTEVIDRPLEDVIQCPDILTFIARQETLDRQRSNSHIDTELPELAPGENYRVSYSHLKDSDKTLIGKMIMFTNITKEKQARKATQEFTAHLSHELLTPMTTIKSYSEMLMDGEIEDIETQKEFYNTINIETARLSRLIKDLLNLSKMEMGGLTLDKSLVKTDWLFEDCIAAVEGTAKEKSIFIHRHTPDNFPSFIGDKDQLKGAIINILGNAVKYTPENGEIHFELSEQNNMVVFDIKDTGYGMSEEDLSHIFDKFYRSQDPNINDQQGTGLGLAITSEIIGLHEGEINVESKLGKGTYFNVKIPKEEYYLGKQ